MLLQTEPWWNCACVGTSCNGRETEIAQGVFLWNGDCFISRIFLLITWKEGEIPNREASY